MHDDKTKTDNEIQKYEAAMKYWKTHDFDPVNIKYYDNEKEDQFVNQRTEEAKVHGRNQIEKLPVSVKNEGMLYNPVNMKVEDD